MALTTHYLILTMSLFLFITCLPHTTTSLNLRILDIKFPMYTYGGVGALYSDLLFGFNGHNCSSSALTSCDQYVDTTHFELDLSSLRISGDNITLSDTPSWSGYPIPPSTLSTFMSQGTGTTSFTRLHEYSWILHPGNRFSPTNVALKYHLLTKQFVNHSVDSALYIPGPSLSDSCTLNDGTSHIYTIGGRDQNKRFESNKTYRLHITDGEWEDMGDLNVARHSASCTLIRGSIYILGGQGDDNEILNSIEMYSSENAEAAQWTELNVTLEIARKNHISVPHPNGWIVTIGGQTTDSTVSPEIEVFDPWTSPISDSMVISGSNYGRKRFFHAVHEYDAQRTIVFLFGGNFNGLVYDDIRYLVLSKGDAIFDDSADSMDEIPSATSSGAIDVTPSPSSTRSPAELPTGTPTPTRFSTELNVTSEVAAIDVSKDGNSSVNAPLHPNGTYTGNSEWESEILDPTMQPHHEAIIEGIETLTIIISIALILMCICIGLLIFMICQRRRAGSKSRLFSPPPKSSPKIARIPTDDHQIEGSQHPLSLANGKNVVVFSEGHKNNAVEPAETHQLIGASQDQRMSIEEKDSNLSFEIVSDEESSNESMYGIGMEMKEECKTPYNTNGTTAVPSYSQHQYAPVPNGQTEYPTTTE